MSGAGSPLRPAQTVSWGKAGQPGSGREAAAGMGRRAHASPASRGTLPRPKRQDTSTPLERSATASTLRSEFVRNSTVQAGHAETYFELNKRQAGLDRLREAAGPNPSPPIKADLDEIQKRFDADRVRLDARKPLINAQTAELVRTALPPFDFAAGAINVGTGDGKIRDYLSIAGALPVGAIITANEWNYSAWRCKVSRQAIGQG